MAAVKIPRSARRRRFALAVVLGSLSLTTTVASVKTPVAGADGAIPRLDHVVILVMENKRYSDIVGRPDEAPFLDSLSHAGANFTQAYGETHPSQPNYIAMFSGSTQGVTNDDCPLPRFVDVPNLGSDLIAAGLSFAGYSESMPYDGSIDCTYGSSGYARKHNPWVEFRNVPATSNKTFASWPSSDYSQLPTVSYVIPNLCHDMHDCSRDEGDAWVESVMYPYAHWAIHNNSMLIVTFDEDDNGDNNHIPTIFYGAHVRPANFDGYINHYTILRTIEEMYGLPVRGEANNRAPLTEAFQ